MVLSGRPVTMTGGHLWFFGQEADGVDGVKKAVRQLVKEGADWIKVPATGGSTRSSNPLLLSYSVEELKAIVEEAHKLGKLTGTHCVSTQGVINSLDAGVDMILHCIFREADGSYHFRPDVAERIAQQGVWVNPTLGAGSVRMRKLQEKAAQGSITAGERAVLEELKRSHEVRLECFQRMVAMGIRMACGSDFSAGVQPIPGFPYEVAAQVEGGYSNIQAVLSAPRDAAEAIGVGRTTGTLEPGKDADLLVVEGTPAEDISALWKVRDVFLAGQQVERAMLPTPYS